ncbi:molybdenum cofactor biosynthesis protein MoaE [Actinotalea sp. Marseille-Q4924]|uniref:molybdenum cofactor biosynthesis protein MoaE n=1 Tax=Actinotalea sp. Marseille-Q4924 TaxID=2866571 RepID=UPI001CE45D80|nr:molybdenum cofactor biosynthesis protein MoaE [Actinotalea sp. Marseille-Q4924]
MPLTRITDRPLALGEHVEAVADPRSGAVATFLGRVRDHDPAVTGEVVALEYSAHPDAQDVLARIAATWAAQEGVLGLAVSHRVGRLAVGDAAIVAAVATAHRRLAFDVCAALVEQVKAELPVWKKEVLADGEHVWVGLEDTSEQVTSPQGDAP